MTDNHDGPYFRQREAQELAASGQATDPTIKRLHWEMAQRYAFLASEAETGHHSQSEAEEITPPKGESAF